MNRFAPRFRLAALLAAFAVLFLAACGGHGTRSSGDDASSSGTSSSSTSTSAADAATPALDVSGDWTTQLDDAGLGVTTFSMDSSGALSGTIRTESGETASIRGHLAAKEAEYTMTFHHRTYLASVDFADSTASGTLVDADGHVHSLKLHR